MVRSVKALDDIFELKKLKRRNVFLSLLIYIIVIVITPCLLGLLIYISQNIPSHTIQGGIDSIFSNNPTLQRLVTVIIEIILLFIFYSTLTSRKISAKTRWITSFFVTLLVVILKILFGLYLSLIPTYQLIYRALAGIPIFLWLYLCWLCFIGCCIDANNLFIKTRKSINK